MLLPVPKLKQAYSRSVTWIKTHKRALIIIFFVVPWISYFLAWLLANSQAFFPRPLWNAKEVLIVVAHPDDESLFFAPTVLRTLRKGGANGNILVLSAGNNYGLGETRKKELQGACKALGITREDRCVVLDNNKFQDNPTLWWDTDLVAKAISGRVRRWNIDAIITFDNGGVSGHINHRAVAAGVEHLLSTSLPTVPTYELKTIFVLRKYAILLDLPVTLILSIPRLLKTLFYGDEKGSWGLMVASPSMYFNARRAFTQHASQVVWDRWIYMILSRYMYVNEIRRVLP